MAGLNKLIRPTLLNQRRRMTGVSTLITVCCAGVVIIVLLRISGAAIAGHQIRLPLSAEKLFRGERRVRTDREDQERLDMRCGVAAETEKHASTWDQPADDSGALLQLRDSALMDIVGVENRDRGASMNSVMVQYLRQVEIGTPQTYKSITVFPLFQRATSSATVRTLDEALGDNMIEVTEVDQAGQVAALQVTSKSQDPILLLDGEELAGAKQNRALNASVLLAANQKITIPVSCTEQGRWKPKSRLFSSSGYVLSRKARRQKAASVTAALARRRGYTSDQSEVWSGIDGLSALHNVKSSTSAMSDVYASVLDTLRQYGNRFPCLPGQTGLLVAFGDEVLGLELLSSDSVYSQCHEKILRSYLIELSLWQRDCKATATLEQAQSFIEQCSLCAETQYKAVGMGTEYRYEGPTLTGFALVNEGEAIHTAFFVTQDDVG